MQAEIGIMATGLALGLSAGMSPGPLFTLVISETLKKGIKEGLKLSTVPLVTDVPILLAGIFIFHSFSGSETLLGSISIIGSMILAYFAYESISFREINFKAKKNSSLGKGVIVNFFNPHLYLTVFTIHVPLMLNARKTGFILPYLYFFSFLTALVSSKMALAFIAHKSKNFMKSKYYVYAVKALGIALFFFAAILFKNGLDYF